MLMQIIFFLWFHAYLATYISRGTPWHFDAILSSQFNNILWFQHYQHLKRIIASHLYRKFVDIPSQKRLHSPWFHKQWRILVEFFHKKLYSIALTYRDLFVTSAPRVRVMSVSSFQHMTNLGKKSTIIQKMFTFYFTYYDVCTFLSQLQLTSLTRSHKKSEPSAESESRAAT